MQKRKLLIYNVWVRTAIVFAGAIVLWLLMVQLNRLQPGTEYNYFVHLRSAVFLFVSVSALVVLANRFLDRRSLQNRSFLRKSGAGKAFILGIVCWVVPAAIGVFVSVQLGWTQITLLAPVMDAVGQFLFLLVVVFLIEAFPEEVVFRGYIYSNLNTAFPQWITVLLQTAIFTLFAYWIGATPTMEQWMFIPGFGFLLGYFRALTGDVWFSIGFHLSIMTATQLLSPIHTIFAISGPFFALHFFSFILLPSIAASILLSFIYGNPSWNKRQEVYDFR